MYLMIAAIAAVVAVVFYGYAIYWQISQDNENVDANLKWQRMQAEKGEGHGLQGEQITDEQIRDGAQPSQVQRK